MYSLKDVEMGYGDISVINRGTLHLPVDGITAVMGPSGSGKSTLLRLLSFLEPPTAGTIKLELEENVFASGNDDRPWPEVTCVFQKQFLWPHLTLRHNIRLPLEERGDSPDDINSRLTELIDMFDMADFLDRFPNEVSGGQAQRAALARAFALRPKLLLLDEAHTGLDLAQQRTLNQYLRTMRACGVAIIIATHSLSFARRYADRIIVVDKQTFELIDSLDSVEASANHYLKSALYLE